MSVEFCSCFKGLKMKKTAKEKLRAIRQALTCDRVMMTDSELKIDVILTEIKATDQERKWAKKNSEAVALAEYGHG